ncbi:hypothetical protein BGZ88_002792 [Linnemannia elongata]|nr:hypothetical protein BGZ88_002792 [Linnemannia elongata]
MQIKTLHSVTAFFLVASVSALPIGNDNGINVVNGNGAAQIFGNQKTTGDVVPQLIQGTLNKPCIGLSAKINAQSLAALANVGVQDVDVLSNPQNQQCTENSTQAKGDEPLSNILDEIPDLSGESN